MAKINGLYVFVTSEDMDCGVEVTEHAVEKGIAISDHVKRNAVSLSVSGEIVGKNAANVLAKIKSIHQSGTVCKYVGRATLQNCLITSLSIGHPNTVWGGYEFSMTLKEIRTAKTSYKSKASYKVYAKPTSTQQKKTNSDGSYVYHTVKKGDTVWALVAASKAPYKNLNRPTISGKSYSACNWVMAMNPSAFSRKGDFGTLQIGKKIIVGVRNGASASTPKANNQSTAKSTKKYQVAVRISGTASHVGSVIVSYTQNGKSANKTIKATSGTFVVSADSGTMLQVVTQAVPNGKVVWQSFNGSAWTKISGNRQRIAKLTKDSSVSIYFYKK